MPSQSRPAEVFVLGSGFSRAISDHMPTLAVLSDELAAYLRIEQPDVLDGFNIPFDDLEVWLSYLAEKQPALSEIQNLENRALFLKIVEWLRRFLAACEQGATKGDQPHWLSGLLQAWHRNTASVITLNYDTLVEAAAHPALHELEDVGGFSAGDLYGVQIPPWGLRIGGTWSRGERMQTFRLLKLHGSLNWYYSGASSFFGEQIYNVLQPPLVWGQPWPDADELVRRAPGRVPLIVPPTAGKSSYFENEMVQELWTIAREDLINARLVICIGYSLPAADLMIRGLFINTLRGKKVEIVNSSGKTKSHYQKILPGVDVVATYSKGSRAVQRFAESYAADYL